jgi:hypothetical protein
MTPTQELAFNIFFNPLDLTSIENYGNWETSLRTFMLIVTITIIIQSSIDMIALSPSIILISRLWILGSMLVQCSQLWLRLENPFHDSSSFQIHHSFFQCDHLITNEDWILFQQDFLVSNEDSIILSYSHYHHLPSPFNPCIS